MTPVAASPRRRQNLVRAPGPQLKRSPSFLDRVLRE